MARTLIGARIDRRMAILALLLCGLLGTGLLSLAAVTDQLTVTNNIAVLTVDIQASRDGTTYQQSITKDVLLDGTVTAAAIQLTNTGNGQATVRVAGAGTGAAAILGHEYRLFAVASQAACTSATTGTNTLTASSTVGSAASAAGATGDIVLAPGATQWLCEIFAQNVAPAQTDTATQTLTFTGTSNLGTQ